jgi:hypothetical protein
MKLLIMQFSPTSCHFIPLRYKYSNPFFLFPLWTKCSAHRNLPVIPHIILLPTSESYRHLLSFASADFRTIQGQCFAAHAVAPWQVVLRADWFSPDTHSTHQSSSPESSGSSKIRLYKVALPQDRYKDLENSECYFHFNFIFQIHQPVWWG